MKSEERSEVGEALKRKVDFLTQLCDSVPCGIIQFTTDPSHKLLHANRTAWEIYGYEKEEYRRIAMDPFQLVSSQDQAQIRNIIDHLTLNSESVTYTRKAQCKNGSSCWIRVTVQRLINAEEIQVFQAVFCDVTELKNLQQQKLLLRNALDSANSANRAKSDFLSRMSHDIRTPMNAIMGMTALGILKLDDPEALRDCFEKISISSQYLLSLINDILDMSKIESGKLPLNLNAFPMNQFISQLSSLVSSQAAERHIHFSLSGRESLKPVYVGDSLRLKQILINLLSNALKFTDAGGTVTLSIREIEQCRNPLRLEFIVTDTGIGMSKAFMQKLYLPFEQEASDSSVRSHAGSGLGLPIVYNLVQLMEGTIQVQSEKGQGTVFTVTIPVTVPTPNVRERTDAGSDRQILNETAPPTCSAKSYDRTAAEQAQPFSQAFCRLKGQSVLLAEDSDLNQEMLRALLEIQGIHVDSAKNGLEAIRHFQASPLRHYLAVLMDVRMPILDGLEATRAIRRLKREDAATVPIIAMTADAFDEDHAAAKEAGMDRYLVKPLDVELLLRELLKLLPR